MRKARAKADPGLIILDTHVWIWIMEGAKNGLTSTTISLIEDAGDRSALVVSAISVWEVAMLETKGRLTLSRSAHEWVSTALTAKGLRLADLTPEIALESSRLPGELHGDPTDRIIVATARVLGATMITCDERILTYGMGGHVRVRSGRSRG